MIHKSIQFHCYVQRQRDWLSSSVNHTQLSADDYYVPWLMIVKSSCGPLVCLACFASLLVFLLQFLSKDLSSWLLVESYRLCVFVLVWNAVWITNSKIFDIHSHNLSYRSPISQVLLQSSDFNLTPRLTPVAQLHVNVPPCPRCAQLAWAWCLIVVGAVKCVLPNSTRTAMLTSPVTTIRVWNVITAMMWCWEEEYVEVSKVKVWTFVRVFM